MTNEKPPVPAETPSLRTVTAITVNGSAAADALRGQMLLLTDATAAELPWLTAGEAALVTRTESGRTVPAVAVGLDEQPATASELRTAAATLARTARFAPDLTIELPETPINTALAVRAVIEGALLARYDGGLLKRTPQSVPLRSLNISVPTEQEAEARSAATTAVVLARAGNLARDLVNQPPARLTARRFAAVIETLAPRFGLEVEVYDEDQLADLRCGAILGVNAGSVEPPRLVRLRYQPGTGGAAPAARLPAAAPAGAAPAAAHLALVGKGITYDSGGISLKTGDPLHIDMKMDMAGAAAVFAAMTTLRELGCETQVTGWLACTDNMISGSATKLGDVLTARDGTTIEVTNTDAEGRLVLADTLTLATEAGQLADAVIDIATLTESSLVALGAETAAIYSNSEEVCDLVQRSSEQTGEQVWRLPLDRRYRRHLNSTTADIKNYSPEFGRGILASLFLEEFTASVPWCHIDMVSTMKSIDEDPLNPAGATGFGARLLAEVALGFGSR